MTYKYQGIPNIMFIGKVMASAMGMYKPALAFGAANFIAAGTAI